MSATRTLYLLHREGWCGVRSTIRLGRVFGIPIGIDPSWFLLLGLVVSVLAFQIYPEVHPGEELWVRLALAGVGGVLFFACIVLHELGHSAVARYYGIPVKNITLFLLGGVAQITRDAKKPLAELLMALAGPCVSILLGGVFMLVWLVSGRGTTSISVMWEWLWVMNISLGIFNLAPAFPMDGGRVLRASLWGITRNFVRATRWAVWTSRVLASALMVFGLVVALGNSRLGIGLSAPNGLWLTFIGFFLLRNANLSLKQVKLLDSLAGHRVESVMLRDLPALVGSTTVREALAGPLLGYGPQREWAFISGDGRFLGVLPRSLALSVPDEQWSTRVVRDVMIPAATLQPTTPDETLADVFQTFQEGDIHIQPVVQAGQVIGLVHEGHLRSLLPREAITRA